MAPSANAGSQKFEDKNRRRQRNTVKEEKGNFVSKDLLKNFCYRARNQCYDWSSQEWNLKRLESSGLFLQQFFCSYAHHFPASCVFKALHQELKVFTVASELWLHSQLLCSPVGVREHFSAKHRLPRSARTRGFKSLLLYLFGTISSSICCFVFYPLWCFSRTPCQIILILKMTYCITGRFYQQSK